ncbi:MAG TPA: zinc ribbon domain-containing protein YjdM [Aquabacterium sp.]|nr:zinc ribbon domain-containing protein YjdM [Aquabacterium sp.]HRH28878.1 zinc ribbon domain-containing protein YjdM [Aquabacterium sp.]
MSTLPACPQCTLENTYQDGAQLICPDCGHEWSPDVARADEEDAEAVIKDSNGQVLTDGDAVILIKDLKLKGSSITLKKGTKVKSIRLVGGDHDVDCKIDGMSVMLKSEFLKKA